MIDDRITLFKKKTACEKIIENLKKLDVINEKPFQKNWFNYNRSLFFNKIFRFLIKVNFKKDNFSKNYIQKYPYLIESNVIKKKSKLLSPGFNFKIKNISMNLVEIDR